MLRGLKQLIKFRKNSAEHPRKDVAPGWGLELGKKRSLGWEKDEFIFSNIAK